MALPFANLGNALSAGTFFDFGQVPGEGILNGNAATIRKQHATTGIEEAMKWITYDPATVGAATAEDIIRGLSRAYAGRLAGGRGPYATPAVAQNAGVILAICRFSLAQHYQIGTNHLIGAQCVAATWVPQVAANGGVARIPAHFLIGTATYAAADQDAADTVNLDNFSELAKFSTVAIPIVAACIFQNGHHFISDGDASSTYMTMLAGHERQYLDKMQIKLETMFNVSKQNLYDLVIHKAPHPITDATFLTVGSTAGVKDVLKGMGYTAVALRLPLMSDKEKAVNNIATIGAQVNSISASLNVSVDPDLCDRDAMVLAACAAAMPPVANVAYRAMNGAQKDTLLEPYLARIMPDAAQAYGMFLGFSEVMGTRMASSLTNSYTFKTARDEHSGLYTDAHSHGTAAARYRKKEKETGGLKGVTIGAGAAAAPADLTPIVDPAKADQDKMMTLMMTTLAAKK